MGKHGIPDRWLDYQPLGQSIPGTKIIAFKVPLKESLCKRWLSSKNKWFTPSMLLEKTPLLKLVIDLTNTNRYYNGQEEFGAKGIDHVKIMVQGQGMIPPRSQLEKFFATIDSHIEKYRNDNDALIGVHCTHGLNRTGYFICSWMVRRLKMHPDEAISKFEAARGHPIERKTLLDNIRKNHHLQRLPPVPTPPILPRSPKIVEYCSPLNDPSYDDAPGNSRYSQQDRFRRNIYVENGGAFSTNKWFKSDRNNKRKLQPSRADLDTNWRSPDDPKEDRGGKKMRQDFDSIRNTKR